MFVLAAAISSTVPLPASASNGMNMIGFGAESLGMGGADLAVARDTTALNTNPAGLSQIPGKHLDLIGGYAYPIEVAHRDRLGNDTAVANRSAFLAGGGYAQAFAGIPLTAGIGLFTQGGAGNVYKGLVTPYGTTDEMSTLLRLVKAAPGVAWRVDESFSVGASLQLVYADIHQKVFPETSFVDPANPSRAFFGIEGQRIGGFGTGVKFGALYRFGDRAAIGAAWTSRIPVQLEDGELTANFTAVGQGKVTYRDAAVEGLSLPQEAGVGISMRPTKTLLVAAEATWLDWSGSMTTSTLRATEPDLPAAPPVLEAASTHNWRDQYVLALGLAWDVTEHLVLRGGYNFGRNPIPDETMSPLLALHAEHHVTFGGGYAIAKGWRTDLAIEYGFNNAVTYDNPELPFGPGAEEVGEAIALHLTLSRAW